MLHFPEGVKVPEMEIMLNEELQKQIPKGCQIKVHDENEGEKVILDKEMYNMWQFVKEFGEK